MAEYKIQSETLTAIGDAIRGKVGITDKFTPAQMAQVIENVNIDLQEKTVTPTTEVQVVTPDGGYYGLSKVTVGATALPEELPSVLDYWFGNAENTIELGATISNESANRNSAGSAYKEIGYSFTATESMAIYGFRVFADGPDKPYRIWDSAGKIMYQHTGAEYTNTGWRDIMFDSPVNLVAGSSYTISSGVCWYRSSTVSYSGKLTNCKTVYADTTGKMPTRNYNNTPEFTFYIGPAVVDSQPEEYSVTRLTMNEIADEVKRISGTSQNMTPAQMITALKAVQTS